MSFVLFNSYKNDRYDNSFYNYNIFYYYPFIDNDYSFDKKREIFSIRYKTFQKYLYDFKINVHLTNLIENYETYDFKYGNVSIFNIINKDKILKKEFILDKLQISDFLIIDLSKVQTENELISMDWEELSFASFYMKEILNKYVILYYGSIEKNEKLFIKLKDTFVYSTFSDICTNSLKTVCDIIIQEHYKLIYEINRNRYLLED